MHIYIYAAVRIVEMKWSGLVVKSVVQVSDLRLSFKVYAYNHVWTAPGVQDGYHEMVPGSHAFMCPACWRRSMTAGPDGIRTRAPNNRAALLGHRYKRHVLLVGATDGHLVVALKPPAPSPGSGCHRLVPVGLAARHHRPHDAGGLRDPIAQARWEPRVSQRHCRQLPWLARGQRQQLGRGGGLAWPEVTDHRSGAHHQQATEPLVAGLADLTQALLAAG